MLDNRICTRQVPSCFFIHEIALLAMSNLEPAIDALILAALVSPLVPTVSTVYVSAKKNGYYVSLSVLTKKRYSAKTENFRK